MNIALHSATNGHTSSTTVQRPPEPYIEKLPEWVGFLWVVLMVVAVIGVICTAIDALKGRK